MISLIYGTLKRTHKLIENISDCGYQTQGPGLRELDKGSLRYKLQIITKYWGYNVQPEDYS